MDKVTSNFHKKLNAFEQSLDLIWLEPRPDSLQDKLIYQCTNTEFYLSIPGIAQFWALPQENIVKVQPFDAEIDFKKVKVWLFGTVMAYILQYRGYHILHGAGVLMSEGAVILSGQSGAGKSTLAAALMRKGYKLLTDDLSVIKRTDQGEYNLILGPNILKLCTDSMQHLHYDPNQGESLFIKTNKYAIPVIQESNLKQVLIKSFYEISVGSSTQNHPTFTHLSGAKALKTLIDNAYRYSMIKPLLKLQYFMNACRDLVEQITVRQIQRTSNYQDLPRIIQQIEYEQECKNGF